MKLMKWVVATLGALMLVSTIYNIIAQSAAQEQPAAIIPIIAKAMPAWPLLFGVIYRENSALFKQDTILFIQACLYALTIILTLVTAKMLKRDLLNWLLLSVAFPQVSPIILCFLRKKDADRFAGIIRGLLFVYGGAFLFSITGSEFCHIITFLGFMVFFSAISKLLPVKVIVIVSGISSLILLYATLFKMPRAIFNAEHMNTYRFIASGLVQWPAVLFHYVIHFRGLSQISFWGFSGVGLYLFRFYLVHRLLKEKKEAFLLWNSANVLFPFLVPNILGLLPDREKKRETGSYATGVIFIVYSMYFYQMFGFIHFLLAALLGFTIIIVTLLRKLQQTALRVSAAATGGVLLAYSILCIKSVFPFPRTPSLQTLLVFFDLPVRNISRIIYMNFIKTFPWQQWFLLGVLISAILLSIALAGKLNRSAWNWGFFSFFLPFVAMNILPYLNVRKGKFYHRPFFFMLMLTGILCALAYQVLWFHILAGVGFFGMLAAGPKAPASTSGSGSSYRPSYGSSGSYSTYTSKSCGSCGRSVSSLSRAGQRCPHCGVYWGYENMRTRY